MKLFNKHASEKAGSTSLSLAGVIARLCVGRGTSGYCSMEWWVLDLAVTLAFLDVFKLRIAGDTLIPGLLFRESPAICSYYCVLAYSMQRSPISCGIYHGCNIEQ